MSPGTHITECEFPKTTIVLVPLGSPRLQTLPVKTGYWLQEPRFTWSVLALSRPGSVSAGTAWAAWPATTAARTAFSGDMVALAAPAAAAKGTLGAPNTAMEMTSPVAMGQSTNPRHVRWDSNLT